MGPHGRLTYERLLNSLTRLHETVAAQFPELEDTQRARDLQRAITDALTTARAGMNGAAVMSPVQLKRNVEARIAKIHAQHDTVAKPNDNTNDSSSIVSFSGMSNTNSPHFSMQEGPASKRTRSSPDSGKENFVPPLAPLSTAVCAPSAVKKTLLTKRASSTKASNVIANKKRPSRNPRSKPVVHALETPLNKTDEADRCAAAAALLGLAEYNPVASSVGVFIPSAELKCGDFDGPRERGRTVHKDERDALLVQSTERTEYADSSPQLKRGCLNGLFAPVPRLEQGFSVQQAFTMGVEYAVMHISSDTRCVGAEIRADEHVNVSGDVRGCVRKQLGLRESAPLDGASGDEHAGVVGSIVARDAESPHGVARKEFWDVV